jgi:small subunit ribosomal protein S10
MKEKICLFSLAKTYKISYNFSPQKRGKTTRSLKRTRRMEKIRIKLQAYDHRVLDKAVAIITDAIKRTGAEVKGPIPLPTKIRRYTVLRSPHINKDSREQFEIRIHRRLIDVVNASPDTVDQLMKLELAPEVDVEVRALS